MSTEERCDIDLSLIIEFIDNHPLSRVSYRGYSIWPNTKTKEHRNTVSGHRWSTQEPASGFYIAGPHASVCATFKTIQSAKEHVDYLINTWECGK